MNPVTKLDLSEMLHAHIEYVYTENMDGSPDMIETGTITAVNELRDGRLQMHVVPDSANRMPKYRIAEDHLVRYIHNTAVIENAVA